MVLPVQRGVESWSIPLPVTIFLAATGLAYAVGWVRLRRASPDAIPAWRLGAFMAGLAAIWIALGSPLVALDDELLTVHMIQHVLLMMAAPPLIIFGAPALPFLHGLPQGFVRNVLGPVLRWQPLQKLGHTLTHPAICWLAAMGALIAWHVPAIFELALRSEFWHRVEHASFFATGLLFWWPVVQPWPSVARWHRWRMPLYLFMATLPCDALSAFLAFCERVVYPSYLNMPQRFTLSPLQDQECAGALMWACATFIYLIPAVVITTQILSPADTNEVRRSVFAEQAAVAERFPSSGEEGARRWCPQGEVPSTRPRPPVTPPQPRREISGRTEAGVLNQTEPEVAR
jgi:putative membrane protein